MNPRTVFLYSVVQHFTFQKRNLITSQENVTGKYIKSYIYPGGNSCNVNESCVNNSDLRGSPGGLERRASSVLLEHALESPTRGVSTLVKNT